MKKIRSIDAMDPVKSKAEKQSAKYHMRKKRSIDTMDPAKSKAQNKKNSRP